MKRNDINYLKKGKNLLSIHLIGTAPENFMGYNFNFSIHYAYNSISRIYGCIHKNSGITNKLRTNSTI